MGEGAVWGEGWWFIREGGRARRQSPRRGEVRCEEAGRFWLRLVPFPAACAQRPRHRWMGSTRRGPLAR